MSLKEQFNTLFAYHWHTNQRLMDCAASLDSIQLTENPGYGQGSIFELLFHLLRTNNSWRLALETGKQTTTIDQVKYSDLDSLRMGFADEQREWEILLDGLEDDQIESDIELTSRHGDVYSFSYWRILQHVVMHGMQHQSELAQLLTQRGCSPGDIDFIFFGFPSR